MIQEEAFEYRKQFRWKLGPIFEMLEHKRQIMHSDDWALDVIQTEASITNNPEQYLGHEFPNINITSRIIKEIFEDYLQDQLNLTE